MTDLQKFQDEAVSAYRKCASMPSVTSGRICLRKDTLTVQSIWSQRNLESNDKRVFSRYFYYPLQENGEIHSENSYEDPFPRQGAAEQLCRESGSGQKQAILRKIPGDKNKEDSQHIEIWSSGSCIKCYTLDALEKHGKVYDDDSFGCFEWSPCERYLLYVAEKKMPKPISYFDTEKKQEEDKVEKGNRFLFKEDWGEQLEGKHLSVLVVLDTQKNEARVLDGIPKNLCPAQAMWSPDSSGVIFCGRDYTPHRLGLKHCHNRKSGIYYLTLDGQSCEMLSDGIDSVHFPRLSPKGNKLIYVARMLYGPHLCCEKIMLYDWKTKETKTLLDVVDKPENGNSFPGYFAAGMARRVWSDDESKIVLDTIWRSMKDIIVIDIATKKVQKVTSGNGCWNLLDVKGDFVLASHATPACPPTLMMGKLPGDVKGELSWFAVAESGASLEKEIDWKVLVFTPENVEKGTWQDYEGYLVKPKGNSEKCPLIVFPHGGPHSSSVAEFFLYTAVWCQLGYAVLLVNYRGSLGFGQSSLLSLPGNVGQQDVRDVQFAAETVLKSENIDPNKVYITGGSHGGFLSCHLIGQYPKFYKACAVRNPVVDLSGMFSLSDCPDWLFCEMGDKFEFGKLPSIEMVQEMQERSPIAHVDKVETPTLLALGAVDRRVPPPQGKGFHTLLRSRGVETRLLLYPDDSHPLAKVETEADVFMNFVTWFATH